MNGIHALASYGVSVWLDDLSRGLLDGAEFADLVDAGVRGVTTNPSIFEKAVGTADAYRPILAVHARRGSAPTVALEAIMVQDVGLAADLLRTVYDASDGDEGFVSMEVDPTLAHDADATIRRGQQIWDALARPNVMVKVPATDAGIAAIEELTARVINVNATLIFSSWRYEEVAEAYLRGVDRAAAGGRDVSALRSVASIFVSRVDTEIDGRLLRSGSPAVAELLGRSGVANARSIYQLSRRIWRRPRAIALIARGARPQRLLWASTGVKDPTSDPVAYVSALAAPGTINTMPRQTLDHLLARADLHAETPEVWLDVDEVLTGLLARGIHLEDVMRLLELRGIDQFRHSWRILLESVAATMEQERKQMRLHFGYDHAGYDLADFLKTELAKSGYDVVDHGPSGYDPLDDYPDFCASAARATLTDRQQGVDAFGIVIGGSGNGEQITANKVPGVRAALVWNLRTARFAREHNDANVIALGAREQANETALRIVQEFLVRSFNGDPRHTRRITRVHELEAEGSATASGGAR